MTEQDTAYDDESVDMREDVGRPRTGAKRSVMGSIRLIPSYIKLLFGLMRDSRVSRLDRLFVIGALAYVISPLDFIPDFIPFFGEVDDIFLVILALQRLLDHAGTRVLMAHWDGDPDELSSSRLARVAGAAGFFLPARLRRRLQRMVRRSERTRSSWF